MEVYELVLEITTPYFHCQNNRIKSQKGDVLVLPGIYLTIGVNKPFYRIRITKAVKQDLNAWFEFLVHFNGVCLLITGTMAMLSV
jgi:arginine/ornithine N-succinyltransferase beta subunit